MFLVPWRRTARIPGNPDEHGGHLLTANTGPRSIHSSDFPTPASHSTSPWRLLDVSGGTMRIGVM